jgi:hypothetical protein
MVVASSGEGGLDARFPDNPRCPTPREFDARPSDLTIYVRIHIL